MSRTALVIVSHTAMLAGGVRELALAMAPEVHIGVAGGIETADGDGLGTSFDRVEQAIEAALAEAEGVVVLTDIGSSVMTAESVVEFVDNNNVIIAHAPLVEGAVAAAVKAQLDGDINEVCAAAQAACAQFMDGNDHAAGTPALDSAFVEAPEGTLAVADGGARAAATVNHDVGLHARPAGLLAQVAATFTSEITIDGADATSALEVMARGIGKGQVVVVEAIGSDAADAVIAIVRGIEQPETLG